MKAPKFEVKLPKGWRILKHGENSQPGDCCSGYFHSLWNKEYDGIGFTQYMGDFEFKIIRRISKVKP